MNTGAFLALMLGSCALVGLCWWVMLKALTSPRRTSLHPLPQANRHKAHQASRYSSGTYHEDGHLDDWHQNVLEHNAADAEWQATAGLSASEPEDLSYRQAASSESSETFESASDSGGSAASDRDTLK